MSADVYIYALVDLDGIPRYVGQSVDPWHRKSNHCSRSAAHSVVEWIESLRAQGKEPNLVVLYKVQPGEDADECERRFIKLLRTTAELLNWRPCRPRQVRTRRRTVGAAMLANVSFGRCLTQGELGAIVGTNASVICRWLSGERKPGRTSAIVLWERFGIPLGAWSQPAEAEGEATGGAP